jgi:hypothetical protein
MTKPVKSLAATLACAALGALAVAPPAEAAFGVVPGTTLGKATQPFHLIDVPNGKGGGTHKEIDVPGIQAAPFATQAGDHPDGTGGATLDGFPAYSLKDFHLDTPPGFLGNPTAVEACDRETFRNSWEAGADPTKGCPADSQLGVATVFSPVFLSSHPQTYPVYRITPSDGYPASFGFAVEGSAAIVNANLRTDGDYGLTLGATDIESFAGLTRTAVTIWGTPADPFHDPDRWETATQTWGASSGKTPIPLIQLPTDCNATDQLATATIDSWQEPGVFLPNALTPNPSDYRLPIPPTSGCEKLSFKPSIALNPSTRNSDSPTGVSVQLEVPQNYNPEGFSTPQLRKAVVTLPAGMSVNPSAATGREGCSSAQIGLLTTHGAYPNPIRFAKGDANCPQASKIGTALVKTALLDDRVEGDAYLATPFDNPFHSLLAIYLVLRGPGFTVKVPGKVEPDPITGQLTTTFDYSPQLSFDSLALNFFGGPRAPLATSPLCGAQPIETELTPWSAPQSGPPATPQNEYPATQGPAGAPCSFSAASRPFSPQLTAGTASPIAGAYAGMTMRLTRADGNQELAGLTVKPPLGFVAKLAGVPYCSEARIKAAEERSGRSEAAFPSCPQASLVGHALVGAGAGPTPLFTEGNAYLSGPYKGAPLSLAVVTPALAGGTTGRPVFDLGTVVVRVALRVDPRTAQITAVSDPVPQTLMGIPLRVRDIRFALDRPNFGLNPTSCADKRFDVDATGQSGAGAALSNRFQVLECADLGFQPRLGLNLKGGTKRGGHPELRAVLRPRSGDANIARASVALPHSAFLDQAHIRTVCTRVQFAAHSCPQGSVYGHARLFTPLLDRPLEGPVYLRSSDNLLPDLVLDLHGQVAIEAVGRIDSVNGGLRTTFDLVPDARFSKFVLTMQGGKKGLIVNSRNLCANPSLATARYVAQNGRRYDYQPQVVAQGCGNSERRKRARHRHG